MAGWPEPIDALPDDGRVDVRSAGADRQAQSWVAESAISAWVGDPAAYVVNDLWNSD